MKRRHLLKLGLGGIAATIFAPLRVFAEKRWEQKLYVVPVINQSRKATKLVNVGSLETEKFPIGKPTEKTYKDFLVHNISIAAPWEHTSDDEAVMWCGITKKEWMTPKDTVEQWAHHHLQYTTCPDCIKNFKILSQGLKQWNEETSGNF